MKNCLICNKEISNRTQTRLCRKCYNDEYFHRPDVLFKRAKDAREKRKKLGDIYKKRERERNKKRRKQRLTYNKKYYSEHSGELKAYQKEYRKNNRDKLLPYWREYGRNNKEIKKAAAKKWKEKNPEKAKALADRHNHARRSANKNVKNTLTLREWNSILEKHNYSCVYCGKKDVKLTKDHKHPLSLGGGLTMDNTVPACLSCNSRKRTKSYGEFMEQIKNKK